MTIVFALVVLALLLIGLVGVWKGDWTAMKVGQGIAWLTVVACLSVETWYPLVGWSRGDGFGLLGLMLVGLSLGAVALGFLLVAALIHSFRGRRSPAIIEGKSELS